MPLALADESMDFAVLRERAGPVHGAPGHVAPEVQGAAADVVGGEDLSEVRGRLRPGAQPLTPVLDQLDPLSEPARLLFLEFLRVPAEHLARLSRQQQAVDELRSEGQLREAAGVMQHLAEATGVMGQRMPRVIGVEVRIGPLRQDCDQGSWMPHPDAVRHDVRFVRRQLEVDLVFEVAVGGRGQVSPHRGGRLRRVAVVVAFGLVPLGRCPGAVVRDAQVESPDAPGAQSAPVDVARHSLEFPTRDAADHSLVPPQMTQTFDEPGFAVSESAGEVGRGHPVILEAFEDPWQEDDVAEPGLDGGRARAEHVRESVPHRAQAQHVERGGFLERAESLGHPVTGGVVEVEPAER